MNLPYKEYIRVPPTATLSGKSVPPCDNTLGSRFAMIPWEVGSDPRLTHRDVRVYFALAAARRGEIAKIGVRRIAEGCHVGYRKIGLILSKLKTCGHVEFEADARGKRTKYVLTSPLFATKPGGLVADAESKRKVSGSREKVQCGRCGERCFGLLKVGWCRSCNWKLKVRKVVEDMDRRKATA